jgi:hypothetical protein
MIKEKTKGQRETNKSNRMAHNIQDEFQQILRKGMILPQQQQQAYSVFAAPTQPVYAPPPPVQQTMQPQVIQQPVTYAHAVQPIHGGNTPSFFTEHSGKISIGLAVIVAAFVIYLIITKFKKKGKKDDENQQGGNNNNGQITLIPPSHAPQPVMYRAPMEKSAPQPKPRPIQSGGPYPVHPRPMQPPHPGMIPPQAHYSVPQGSVMSLAPQGPPPTYLPNQGIMGPMGAVPLSPELQSLMQQGYSTQPVPQQFAPPPQVMQQLVARQQGPPPPGYMGPPPMQQGFIGGNPMQQGPPPPMPNFMGPPPPMQQGAGFTGQRM